MIKRILSVMLAAMLVLSLASCGEAPEQAGEFLLASEISPEKQAEADVIVDALIAAFETGETKDLFPYLSKDFNTSEEELAEFIGEVRELTTQPFVKYDSYYVNNLEKSEIPVRVKKLAEDKNYIEFKPADKEVYCALLASENEKISYMLCVLLEYKGGKASIALINPGDFKYNGETAPVIYERAKKLDSEKKTIAAYLQSCLYGNIFRPAGYYRYENDAQMEDLGYKLYADMQKNFELPIKISDTVGIYEISIANDKEHGVIPLVLFKTDVPISDKAKIREEAEKVFSELEKKSPGIKESFDYIRMNATNDELNENTTSVTTESMTLEI